MTLPALPAQGSTDWYSWAQGVHSLVGSAMQASDVGSGNANDQALKTAIDDEGAVKGWGTATSSGGTSYTDQQVRNVMLATLAGSGTATISTDSTTTPTKITVVSNVNYANLPANSIIGVKRVNGSWPARPTKRSDIICHWIGADPDPAVDSTGTVFLDGVDFRFVTP